MQFVFTGHGAPALTGSVSTVLGLGWFHSHPAHSSGARPGAGSHLVSPVQEQQLAELAEVRQVLQADLGTSIRRIADLQVALEGLRDSDDSDADR